jgi:CubicO group peptidase (beta-lactamase class C family)
MKLRPGNPEEAGMSAERVRHVVDLAKGWVVQGITPALVVLAARRGVVVIHEAFGRLTPEQDSPSLELDTIFPLTSLTKPITATSAMILVEDGLLGLNRPVSEYIPEFTGEEKENVMVHHLLTHTSGLKEGEVRKHAEKKKGAVEIPPADETQPAFMNEHLFLRYDAPLSMPPGKEMSYCSIGYNLLGEIVRRTSGKSVDDFARERIFQPLGMKDTYYILPESEVQRIVRRSADAPFAEYLESRERPLYSSGAWSTAMDMTIFGQMFLNGGIYDNTRILSPASVAEMTRDQIPGIGSRYEWEVFPGALWGFGWSICGNKKAVAWGETLQSPATFCHGGSGNVFLWVDPVYEIVGSYFFVSLQPSPKGYYQTDLFINAVTAAIVDV